jgi:DNA-binding XRE family transcriptional regulator
LGFAKTALIFIKTLFIFEKNIIMDMNKIVAQRIMEAREQKGLLQKDMAAALDLSTNAYNSIENGKTELKINVLYKISEILQLPISKLLNINEGATQHNHKNIVVTQNINGTLYFQVSNEQMEKLMENKKAPASPKGGKL